MGLSARRIKESVAAVAAHDPYVAAALADVGFPQPRKAKPGFDALLRIMIGQQVSIKAAASIHGRLVALIGDRLAHDAILSHSDEELRAVGLSRQKAAYARSLAEAVAAGALNFRRLRNMPEEDAKAAICAVKGYGPWSAEIYLLFCEGRPDIWPAGDLALQAALHRLYDFETRPSAKRTFEIVEPWRPHRGAMAVFLWHYYANSAAPV